MIIQLTIGLKGSIWKQCSAHYLSNFPLNLRTYLALYVSKNPLQPRVGDFILGQNKLTVSVPFQSIYCEVKVYLSNIHHADSLL